MSHQVDVRLVDGIGVAALSVLLLVMLHLPF